LGSRRENAITYLTYFIGLTLTVTSTEFEEGGVPVGEFSADFTVSCLSVQPVTLTIKIEKINNKGNAFLSGMLIQLFIIFIMEFI